MHPKESGRPKATRICFKLEASLVSCDRLRHLRLRFLRCVPVTIAVGTDRSQFWLGQHHLRLLVVEGRMATAAKIVIGPELDEMTTVATKYFP